ncbi:MAG: two-component regulator propeller domain-containing protein [Bacteroidia bacterium]
MSKNNSYQVGHRILFLVSLLWFACNGHYKTTTPQESPEESPQATVVDTPTPWVDPLFFLEGQLCQHVRQLFQDSRGDIWIGTNVYDLMRYNGDSLQYFNQKAGFDMGRITGIVEDKAGHIWFGTYRGLWRYSPSADSGSFTNFTEEDGLIENEIWSLALDRNGIFWIGTMEGVSRFDGATFSDFEVPKPAIKNENYILSPDRITAISEDLEGNIWIGTDGFGVVKYSPEQKAFKHFTTKNGLPDNNVGRITADSKGNIWFGTMFGGISRYDHKTFNNFTQDSLIKGVEIAQIYEDKKGNIWFPVENHGVYRFNPSASLRPSEKSFRNFYKAEGIETNGMLCMLEDQEGRFWFGGWGGLFRYNAAATNTEGDRYFFSVTEKGLRD